MYVKTEVDYCYLEGHCWGGAAYVIRVIIEHKKVDELLELLDEVFCDDMPTDTELNDYLWFESDSIFEYLGIEESSDNEED